MSTTSKRFTGQVEQRRGHVAVHGVSATDVEEALGLLSEVRNVQADQAAARRTDLTRLLMVSGVDLTPPATVVQAQRLARQRDALLASPVLTHETLSQLRSDRAPSATRTWLSRRRQESAVFTVTHEGRTLIPAFQLTAQGDPRPELRPMITVLRGGGVDGWALWTWLTSPSSNLSGETPESLAARDPVRALRAATRFASPPAA